MASNDSQLNTISGDSGMFLVYTTTHPPYTVDSTHEDRQRQSTHIRRLPSVVFTGRGRASRPSSSSSNLPMASKSTRPSSSCVTIPLARSCDILKLIMDETGEKEVEVHTGEFLPVIQEENSETKESHTRDTARDKPDGGGHDSQVRGTSARSDLGQLQSSRSSVNSTPDEKICEWTDSHDGQFDTDFSDPEEIFDISKKKKRKAETLQVYKIACMQYKLVPRSAFEKQCGQVKIDLINRLSSADDLKAISVALMGDTDTRDLDLSSNPLTMSGGADLGHMMSKNQSITKLNLSGTGLGRDGLGSLVNALVYNNKLTILNLAQNNLQGQDEKLLARLLQKLPCLEELYLGHNSLGSPSITHLAGILEEVTCSLKVLDLQYNHIRKDAAACLTLAIAKNQSLVNVNLSWNGLGSEGCVGLTRVLSRNKTLTELDISATRICAQDVEMLTRGLWNNNTLQQLRISSNPMTTVGAKSLAKSVLRSKCSALKELDLSSIPVDEDFVFLANLLDEHNSTRVIYDVTGNLLPLMEVNVTPWPKEGPDLGFYKPVTVLFEYMKLERMRIIDLFEFLDHQKRGKISRSDLRRGIHEMMIPFSEHDVEELMSRLDTNTDGFISFDELLQAYKYQYYSINTRKTRARLTKVKDGGLTDLWDMLREIIRKRRPAGNQRVTWYTLVQERWRK